MASIVYQTPGVYIEEVLNGARPIQSVGTRTAGFIGVAPNAARYPKNYLNEAVAVNNWAEFVRRFASPPSDVLTKAAADQNELKDHIKSAGKEAYLLVDEYKKNLNEEYKNKLRVLEDAAKKSDATLESYRTSANKDGTISESEKNRLKELEDTANQSRAALEAYSASPSKEDTLSEEYKNKLEGLVKTVVKNQAARDKYLASANQDGAISEKEKTRLQELEDTANQSSAALEAYIKSAGKEDTLSKEYKDKLKELQIIATQSSVQASETFRATKLSLAVYGFFLNGGSRCYVVNVGSDDAPITSGASGQPLVGLDVLEGIDEVAIVVAPGYTEPQHYEAIRSHCDKMRDRVGILDGPEELDDQAMLQLSGERGQTDKWTMPANSERGYVTLYVPWIEVSNPDAGKPSLSDSTDKEPETIMVPPSGHVAGVWARTDATRGVHKAPANEIVRGALGLAKQVTHEEQGMLNAKGVNVIRYFPNEGFLIWGARTLTNQAAFRYLNVRRLFNMIEESIAESTRWIVFEPNDRPLWKAIRRDVTAFLMGFWRDGALMGRTPEEAFYVKCDEETNPIESIREGKVIIEVGLAPVLPAEFVIFRISQYEAGTEVELQS